MQMAPSYPNSLMAKPRNSRPPTRTARPWNQHRDSHAERRTPYSRGPDRRHVDTERDMWAGRYSAHRDSPKCSEQDDHREEIQKPQYNHRPQDGDHPRKDAPLTRFPHRGGRDQYDHNRGRGRATYQRGSDRSPALDEHNPRVNRHNKTPPRVSAQESHQQRDKSPLKVEHYFRACKIFSKHVFALYIIAHNSTFVDEQRGF